MLWDTLLWNPALKVSPCVARLWEWGDYVRVTQTTKLGARERGREWRALVGAGTHQTSWKASFSCAIPQKSEIYCKKDTQQRNEIFCCILIIWFQHLLWFWPLLSELCVLSANVLFVSDVVFAGVAQHQLFANVFSLHVQEELLQLMVLGDACTNLIIGKSL